MGFLDITNALQFFIFVHFFTFLSLVAQCLNDFHPLFLSSYTFIMFTYEFYFVDSLPFFPHILGEPLRRSTVQ